MRKQAGLVPLVLTFLTALGCGDEYRDDYLGVLDLSGLYEDNNTAAARAPIEGALPTQINPITGYLDGERAEYYDFGDIPGIMRDSLTGEPLAVKVQPMYFFFTSDGRPLFSAPVREERDGSDHMPGGKAVRNPNPKDFCADLAATRPQCELRNQTEKKRPYAVRLRDLLIDPDRRVADYQRPIVDVTPADRDAFGSAYSGFWEIVEVRAPSGYDPDAIKHASTLAEAVSSGGFKMRSTGKVINCPMLDERTYVPRGITSRNRPHPRMEIWYRRKLSFCFLANGWETLGNDKGERYFADQDADRFDTFDISRIKVGQGTTQTAQLVVPISRAYVPTIFTFDQAGGGLSVTRISASLVTQGRQRRFPNDPPGYTPARWMWDFPADSDYQPGALRSLEELDTSAAFPRDPISVRNIPLRGVTTRCSLPETLKTSLITGRRQCGRVVTVPGGSEEEVDATGDPVCNGLGLECNKDTCTCDAPFVGYGQACGPGIAQCSPEPDEFSDFGYTCFPASGGFCYLSCGGINQRASENEGKQASEIIDTRCKSIPGMTCLTASSGSLCLKFCDQNVTDPGQCSASATRAGETVNIGDGQVCQDYGLQVCSWPDTYSPN